MPFRAEQQLHQYGFAPDLPWNTPGILLDSSQVYPTIAGVRLLPSLVLVAQLPPNAVVSGAFNATFKDGSTAIFATSQGPNGHLYLLSTNPNQWKRNDGTQNFTSANPWRFTVFASDCIATNGVDPIQVSAGGALFAPLGGQPPLGSIVASVDPGGTGAFAFVFNTANSALSPDSTFWACSKQGVDNVWSLNVADLSTSGFLQSTPGPITAALALGTSMVAYKQNSIYVGQFTGPPFVWNFQPADTQYGVPAQEGLVDLGDYHAFVSYKYPCFYTFNGSFAQPVPNACGQWFLANVNKAYFPKTQARYDSNFGCVFWYFSSKAANPAGSFDKWVCWNITNNRWTKGNLNFAWALSANDSATLSQLFTADNALKSYTGKCSPGFITTGYNGEEARLTYVTRARLQWGTIAPPGYMQPQPGGFPAPAGATARVTPILYDQIAQQIGTAMPIKGISPRGWFDLRATARYLQFQYELNSDAEVAGFYYENQDGGVV